VKALLLDTHAFLWFVTDDPRLAGTAASLIADAGIAKHISLASLWEIAIKSQLEKLNLGTGYDTFFQEYITAREVELIPIDLRHLSVYSSLPLHHRDPFDRMIIAQAIALDLPIVTRDPNYAAYRIDVVWE